MDTTINRVSMTLNKQSLPLNGAASVSLYRQFLRVCFIGARLHLSVKAQPLSYQTGCKEFQMFFWGKRWPMRASPDPTSSDSQELFQHSKKVCWKSTLVAWYRITSIVKKPSLLEKCEAQASIIHLFHTGFNSCSTYWFRWSGPSSDNNATTEEEALTWKRERQSISEIRIKKRKIPYLLSLIDTSVTL